MRIMLVNMVLKGIGLLWLFMVFSFFVFVVVMVDNFWLKLLLFSVINFNIGIKSFIINKLILFIVFEIVMVLRLLKIV